MIVDFHTHSQCSDGHLVPQDLVDLAAVRGCEQIAITDHDTVAAYAELDTQALPVRLIGGCEFSTQWQGLDIHVVGLNLDLHSAELLDGLAQQQAARQQRAQRIADQLARQGFADAHVGALEFAQGGSVGRPHFARYLVEQGAVANFQQAFKRYLAAGKPAYVRTEWADLEQVCGWIIAAGGIAVLAHPLKYKMTHTKLRSLLLVFKAAGGGAVEVVSGAQQPEQTRRMAALARQFDLLASVGSDFHQLGQPWAALGQVAALPEGCKPIWSRW